MKGKLGAKGRFYTVDGVKQRPRQFASMSAFKLLNYVILWAVTNDRSQLDFVKRWLDRWQQVGINRFRVWYDYTFWLEDQRVNAERGRSLSTRVFERQMNQLGLRHSMSKELKLSEDFWATPANLTDVINLKAKPGRNFRLSRIEKKVLRKLYRIGLERGPGFFWDWTPIATIKHYEPGYGDPRRSQLEVNIWLGHYMAAVGDYIRLLRKEIFDDRPPPFQFEIANEFNTAHPSFNRDQIENMCRRWQARDAYEPIGIDQAGTPVDGHGNPVPYIPRLYDGPRGPFDIRFHGPRDRELPWRDIAKYAIAAWGNESKPLYHDETILLMPRPAYDSLPKGHPWRYLGTKDFKHYGDMFEDHCRRNIYICFHTGGNNNPDYQYPECMHGNGLSGGWMPEGLFDEPGEIDDFIRELLS